MSCPAPGSCTAAGDYVTGSGAQKTLAERWNGTTWAIQVTANPGGGTFPSLNGLSCPSAAVCTATGTYDTSTGWRTLAERWNGTKWAIQATPNPAGDVPGLSAVACPSATACTATGSYQTSSGGHKTLAERYDAG